MKIHFLVDQQGTEAYQEKCSFTFMEDHDTWEVPN